MRPGYAHQFLLATATGHHPIDPLELFGLVNLCIHLVDLSYYALICLESGALTYQSTAHLLLTRRVHKYVVALAQQVIIVNLLRLL